MIGKMAGSTDRRDALGQARARSDALFDLVRPEAFYERPVPERHRIISTWAISRPLTGISSAKRQGRSAGGICTVFR